MDNQVRLLGGALFVLSPAVQLGVQQVDDVFDGNRVVLVSFLVARELKPVAHGGSGNSEQQF